MPRVESPVTSLPLPTAPGTSESGCARSGDVRGNAPNEPPERPARAAGTRGPAQHRLRPAPSGPVTSPAKRWALRALWTISVVGLIYATLLIVSIRGEKDHESSQVPRYRPAEGAPHAQNASPAAGSEVDPGGSPAVTSPATEESRVRSPAAATSPSSSGSSTGAESEQTEPTTSETPSAEATADPEPTASQPQGLLDPLLSIQLGITI